MATRDPIGRWWESDPVTITALDSEGRWASYLPAPSTRRLIGHSEVDFEQLAAASARLLGYEHLDHSFERTWVRLLGPIEYAHATVMPVDLNERVERALADIELDNVFEYASFFKVDHRTVRKGVKIRNLHHEVRSMISGILVKRVLDVPKPYEPPRPTRTVRSGQPSDEPAYVIRSGQPSRAGSRSK